ncbi:hypothetical protein ACFQ9X_09930 [Catenulispora yoronensis]
MPLLPTVRAADGNRGPTLNSPTHAGGEDLVTTVVKLYRDNPENYPLLPTPTARDWKSSASNMHRVNSRPLNEVVAKLYHDNPTVFFKTATANLGRNGSAQHPDCRKAGGHGPTLQDEVCFLLDVTPEDTAADGPHSPAQWWGKFGPAVHRWDALTGTAAPVPVIRGPRGGIKLSPGSANGSWDYPTAGSPRYPASPSTSRSPTSATGSCPRRPTPRSNCCAKPGSSGNTTTARHPRSPPTNRSATPFSPRPPTPRPARPSNWRPESLTRGRPS